MKRSNVLTPIYLSSLFALSFAISPVTASADDENATNKVMTQGLNHLGLSVKHLERSADFFINTLGWKKAGGYPDYPSLFVTDGKMFLTLWQTQSDAKTIEFDRKHNVGLHHLAFSVASLDDLNALHTSFKKIDDIEIEFAPQPNGGGPTIHMMIREPSGNRLEFAFNPPRK